MLGCVYTKLFSLKNGTLVFTKEMQHLHEVILSAEVIMHVECGHAVLASTRRSAQYAVENETLCVDKRQSRDIREF